MTPAAQATIPAQGTAKTAIAVEYKMFFGAKIAEHAHVISPLLSIYGEWPYLYQQSDPLEDIDYIMDRYAKQTDSVVCIAYNGPKAIGVAMGVPLTQAPPHYRDAFPENERRPDIFYWGELVVLKEYRGKHVAHEMYTRMAAHILGKYKAICFASLEREDNYKLAHLKPAHEASLDSLWKRLGFEKRPDIKMQGKWTVLGDSEDSLHDMFYWWKKLD